MSGRPSLPDLPVREVLDPLRRALSRERSAVLVAPPGAGKTTLVPPTLLDEDWLGGGRIVMLEPRRLAAVAAARRIAELLGEDDAGGTVGYRIRHDTRVGRDTRIEVVTEGVLTRMLVEDPGLRGVGLVVFDEFHERSLPADVGLALSLQAREVLRPDLGILVMSATIDAEPVAELLGGAPVVRSEGRLFPVETRFRASPVEGWIEPAVAGTVLRSLERDEGDLLVFLPGAAEIRRTATRLDEAALPDGVDVVPLFGNLPRSEQDRAIRPSPPGRRKVVLATSIAETSLTIDGVRVVVDSGRMRVPRFDPGSGMTRLDTVTVTRDAADQRRGRAGRTAPGIAYRLWTEGEDRGLVPSRTPEIREADLAPLALDLAVWGAGPDELRWLDPPPGGAWAQAEELLRGLGLLDDAGTPTDRGRAVAALGAHPRLGTMVHRAESRGRAALACRIAALLSERDPLRGLDGPPDPDLRLRLDLLGRGRSGAAPPGHRVDRGALARVRREIRHWERRAGVRGGDPPSEAREEAGHVLAYAFPDRLGRRRPGSHDRFLLRNGRGAALHEPGRLTDADWIVAAEVGGRGGEARIFLGAPLDEAELQEAFGDRIEVEDSVRWDGEAERVRADRVTRLGAIELSRGPLPDPPTEAVTRALLDGIRTRGLGALPWSKEVRGLRERIAFLVRQDPERWPDVSDDTLLGTLEEWLGPFLAGHRTLDGIPPATLGDALLARLGWEDRDALDRLAPTHLQVPSGSRIPLDYGDPEAPALAVRLQELFGLAQTPRIAGGRVPLVIRLLSPAHRPVQVTRDLASFWRDAYHEVRKDLRGRYPKHAWPEDPTTAEPTSRARRRRS